MRSVETDWWIIDLPDEWEAEQDEETIVIGDEDGVGALEITTLERHDQGPVDLQALARELVPVSSKGAPVDVGDFRGLYFEYREDDDAVREWLLQGGDLLLLISYSCAAENQDFDAAMVDEILDTLQLKQPAH